MVTNNCVIQEILSRISEECHFKELILTPEGTLFIDLGREIQADEYWLYTEDTLFGQNTLHVNSRGECHTYGSHSTKEKKFPLMKNKTTISPLKQGGCALTSKNGGIPYRNSLIAFLRYSNICAFIIAGDIVSHRSFTVILEATKENDAVLSDVFAQHLQQHNPEMASYLTTSQVATSLVYAAKDSTWSNF